MKQQKQHCSFLQRRENNVVFVAISLSIPKNLFILLLPNCSNALLSSGWNITISTITPYVINEESNKPEFVEIKGNYFEDDKYIYIDFRKNEISEVDTVKLHDRIILKPNFINKRVSKIN